MLKEGGIKKMNYSEFVERHEQRKAYFEDWKNFMPEIERLGWEMERFFDYLNKKILRGK